MGRRQQLSDSRRRGSAAAPSRTAAPNQQGHGRRQRAPADPGRAASAARCGPPTWTRRSITSRDGVAH